MVMCEKPLGRTAAEARGDGRGGRDRPACPNTVWYNYRRVPAVTLIKQLLDEGKFGRIFHYRAKFLQDWTISQDLPQGGEGLWRLDVVGRRQRRHRRSARAQHRHRALAERPDHRSHRDDRNVHQGAQAQPDGQGRAGRHRRCERVSVPVRERLARDVRGDALRARAQGALHARDQRRARVGVLGSARPAPHPVLRSPRRRARARLAQHPRHRRRSAVHEALVGARACRSATSTRSSTSSPISSRRRPRARACAPTFRDGLATDYVTDAVLKSAKTGQWETGWLRAR